MRKEIVEIIKLKEDEEIEMFEIIEEYESKGFQTILNKSINGQPGDTTSDFVYMLGFVKYIEE
jgi:hypothetical protein